MKIYHIAAMSENHVIGRQGKIPWQIRDDLKRFKEITVGHPVIMGRLTFESLGKYAPLPSRRNIVLTSATTLSTGEDGRPKFNGPSQEGVTQEEGERDLSHHYPPETELMLANDIGEALSLCDGANEIYIIGGGGVYEDTLDIADELRLTFVHKEIEGGDTFYPEIDPEVWVTSYVEPHETHTYLDYVRKDVKGKDLG